MQTPIPFEIIGTGFHVPETVITNEDYERMHGVPAGWIKQACGIEERRAAAPHEACSHLAIPAAEKAIKAANIDPSEIDLIILSTISSDFSSPPSACLVQAAIGATNAACLDVDCACLGYVWALYMGSLYLHMNDCRNVLVVAAERSLHAANYEDPTTFILLGDGAGAAVLKKSTGDSGIISWFFKSDGSRWEVATIKGGGTKYPDTRKLPEGVEMKDLYFRMDGTKIYKFAVRAMIEAVETVVKKAGLEKKDIKLVIPHQANLRILESAISRMGLKEDQYFINVHKYGNTGGATVAIALADAENRGRIKKGDYVVLAGFGAGLSWGSILLRW